MPARIAPIARSAPSPRSSPAARTRPFARAAAATIDAAAVGQTIPPAAFGFVALVSDTLYSGAQLITDMTTNLNCGALRYPGGVADAYHFTTLDGSYTPTVPLAPFYTPGHPQATIQYTFDNWMVNQVQAIAGATPVVAVNYGSNAAGTDGGDPNEAAAWVTYANVTKGYGVTWWELGNELYNNGWNGQPTAGAGSVDLHASLQPEAYGANYVTFQQAMKAVDPTIKLGVSIYGDTPGSTSPYIGWNARVFAAIKAAGGTPDALILHWYPQGFTLVRDWLLLTIATPVSIPAVAAQLAAEVAAQWPGVSVPLMITEMNNEQPTAGQQTISALNALHAVDAYLTWLEQTAIPVALACWFCINAAPQTDATLALINSGITIEPSTYGDYGIRSIGGTSGGVTEPTLGYRFPAWYGLNMLRALCRPGDAVLPATGSGTSMGIHAVRRRVAGSGDTKLGIALVNRQPCAQTAVITLANYTPAGAASVTTYGYGLSAPVSSTPTLGTTFSVTLPAYQMVSVVL